MEKDKKFRALAIAAICVAIVGVSVAYAALNASLTISGQATVSTANAWKIQWSNVTDMTKSTGVVAAKPTITSGNQAITWTAEFKAPKTYLEFTATVQNSGTIPAKLESGTYVSKTDVGEGSASTKFTYTVTVDGTDISDKAGYVLKSEESFNVKVRVDFDSTGSLSNTDFTNLNDDAVQFTLTLPWSQATDSEVSAATSNNKLF